MYNMETNKTITIGGRSFEGPFTNAFDLQSQSGVYVILGRNKNDDWYVVDVGESENVYYRVKNHDRQHCWSRQRYDQLSVAVYYTNNEYKRLNLEQQIRHQYNPPCGER